MYHQEAFSRHTVLSSGCRAFCPFCSPFCHLLKIATFHSKAAPSLSPVEKKLASLWQPLGLETGLHLDCGLPANMGEIFKLPKIQLSRQLSKVVLFSLAFLTEEARVCSLQLDVRHTATTELN